MAVLVACCLKIFGSLIFEQSSKGSGVLLHDLLSINVLP